MSMINTIDGYDKLELNDMNSFAITSTLIAKSIQQYNNNPSIKFDELKLLFEIDSPEIILQQKAIEHEYLENNNKIIPFTTILDSCLSQSSLNRPNISQQSLYLPFCLDQPIDYESIQSQLDPSTLTHFMVQSSSSNQILQPRNEPSNDINTNTVTFNDSNDDKIYVDTVDNKENEIPKLMIKKKGKKKKQQQINIIEKNNDISIQLNTSSKRTSSAGQKLLQKLSSKWSFKKRISGITTGKTSGIRKLIRSSHDRQNRADSRTLIRTKTSITSNANRLSQEQRDQLICAAEERKQEERKRKIEKLNEQAKKREEVLVRAKQIQQNKDQKNQSRISDDQSKNITINQNKKIQSNNNSINESTAYINPITPQYKPVILDTTSNKIIKNQTNSSKKLITTNNEYTSVVDKNNLLSNDINIPSSSIDQSNSQYKLDWTVLPISEITHNQPEIDMNITGTTQDSNDGDYGIEDIRSDQNSDSDEEDETRIPNWAKERLFQTFWKAQGHWYLSRRTLKLTRRTFGHYPILKDQVQVWLKELKSNKPLSETFTDATYLDQTPVYF